MNERTQIGLAALLLRVALGVMFLAHGLTKWLVFTPAGTVEFFASLGYPAVLAYAVMVFEVAAGVLLLLGVLTRWVSAIAVVQLFGAATVHFSAGWGFGNEGGGWEYPIFMVVTAAALAFLGSGPYAIGRTKAD